MDLRVCSSLEDHFDAIRAYINDAKDEQSDRTHAFEEEIEGLELDLKDAERDRDDFEEEVEKLKKEIALMSAFVIENGLESQLETYLNTS